MLGRIGNALGCFVLNGLRGGVVPVKCAKCGSEFKPFENHTFTRFGEIMEPFPCPRCEHPFRLGDHAKANGADAANPPGPHPRPAKSRIERSEPTPESLLFIIPRGGRAGGLLLMGIIWCAFTIPMFSFVLTQQGGLPALIMAVFVAVGLGMLYAAIRMKYSTYLIYLSPELLRVQRQLLFRSTQDLRPEEVRAVKLVEFYTENYVPVHGIEIAAGKRRIRFGTKLTDEEKRWLAWEMRHFLRRHCHSPIPPEKG